jgi:hypothetical protein
MNPEVCRRPSQLTPTTVKLTVPLPCIRAGDALYFGNRFTAATTYTRGTLQSAGETLRDLVETEAYVGEVVSVGDSEAIVQIHDHHWQRVGGIPALCFLLATRVNPQTTPDWKLRFGSDISNYYPDRGLKVYKPRGEVLARVVNFRDPLIFATSRIPMVQIGQVRYASTNRRFQQVASVAVSVTPTDLLGQKTALFGTYLG